MFDIITGVKKALEELKEEKTGALEEKCRLLENLRQCMLKKQVFLLFLLIFSILAFVAITRFLSDEAISSCLTGVLFIVIILLLFHAASLNAEYELKVKNAFIDKVNEDLNAELRNWAKVKWNSSYFEQNIERVEKRYNRETGLNYNDLTKLEQLKYQDRFLFSDVEKLFTCGFVVGDKFDGICEEVKFSFFEGFTNQGKEIEHLFCGIVVKILCDISYKSKLVIKKPGFGLDHYHKYNTVKNLIKLPKTNKFINKQLGVYTSNVVFASEVLTQNFIDFVNKLGPKYVYTFIGGNLYLLKRELRDMFKMSSLYKSINVSILYENFNKDLMEILNIVSLAKNIEYIEKPTERDLKFFGFKN